MKNNQKKKGVDIHFNVGNAAFRLDDERLDMISVGLKVVQIGNRIADGECSGSIIDVNGNKVGEFSVKD